MLSQVSNGTVGREWLLFFDGIVCCCTNVSTHLFRQAIEDGSLASRQNSSAVLFFDEISRLAPDRKNLSESSSHKEEEINEFLMQLNDAAENGILVVGATNYVERIYPAILRPGRIDKKIYVLPPDFEARKELFKIGLSNRPYDKKIDFKHLAKITEGFTCADIIKNVVESAARIAANLNKPLIDQSLLEDEIKRIMPKTTKKKK